MREPAYPAARVVASRLHEHIAKSAGSAHPGVLLLFPQIKPDEATKLAKKVDVADAITTKIDLAVGDKKTVIGLALTLIGVSSAA